MANTAQHTALAGTHELLNKKIGFVGAGRLARAMALALQAIGLNVAMVASRSNTSAQAMADSLNNCSVASMQELADRADIVFVTTTDGAIEDTVNAIQWHTGQAVIHCSGATEISVLKNAQDAGAEIGGFHPMQSFGQDSQAAIASLPGCTIAIEASPKLESDLIDIAKSLGCNPVRLPAGARALYHASGGYAADKVHVMLSQAVSLWQSWGATEDQAMAALLPLLKGTVASLERSGLVAGMPGPISRGDVNTITKHRHSIEKVGSDMRAIYDVLSLKAVDIAEQAGKLDENVLFELRQELKSKI